MSTQDWVKPVTLEGRFVRLEPLSAAHAADLLESTPRDTFRYFPKPPADWTLPGFTSFIETLAGAGSERIHFAVILRENGRAVGSTSYYDIRPAHRGVEIGYTWYGAGARGTAVNPESKLLLLGHAFDTLGAERVALRTDARNAQSRAAILKLGAKEEGTFRRHLLMSDGHWRDTVYYSILRDEWPGVRAGLETRLAAFG